MKIVNSLFQKRILIWIKLCAKNAITETMVIKSEQPLFIFDSTRTWSNDKEFREDFKG